MATDNLQATNDASLAIAKKSYADLQMTTLGKMLDIMGTQYRMTITRELTKFWKQALLVERSLSPEQIRKGFLAYMGDPETTGFPPQPGDIVRLMPSEAPDRPRKVRDPNCQECKDSPGFRKVLTDSKIHPGKKAWRMTDCYCVSVVYDGKTYTPEARQLPAAPTERSEGQILNDLADKLPDIAQAAKPMPSSYAPSDQDLQRKKREAFKAAKRFKA